MNSPFWVSNHQPAIFLAPMEGVTDAPLRELLTSHLPFTHSVSEFLRVTHQVIPKRLIIEHVPELQMQALTASGTPVIVQLLGGDPDRLAATALQCIQLGARAIDLNFGCPAPTVNRHDGGATLLKYPQRMYNIVKTLRQSVPSDIPVSAKIRLGFDDPSSVYENAEMVFAAGADWLTIHARTRSQGYRPPVFWNYIADIKKEAPIPVIANGDIWTFEDYKKCREMTGCDHFMLGRGALANPNLVNSIAKDLGIEAKLGFGSWNEALQKLAEVYLRSGTPPSIVLRKTKQWLSIRKRQFETPCFDTIKLLDTYTDLEVILRHPLDMGAPQRAGLSFSSTLQDETCLFS